MTDKCPICNSSRVSLPDLYDNIKFKCQTEMRHEDGSLKLSELCIKTKALVDSTTDVINRDMALLAAIDIIKDLTCGKAYLSELATSDDSKRKALHHWMVTHSIKV